LLICVHLSIFARYWKYSVNEHGTKDMPAIIEEIHKIKISELGKSQPQSAEGTGDQNDKLKSLEVQASQEDSIEDQPYKLCAVCHSLGGAVMLMYVVTSRITQKPHRLSRLVLLSPAGFHEDSNVVFSMVEKLILFVGPVLAPLIPGLYIPTRFFRMLLISTIIQLWVDLSRPLWAMSLAVTVQIG
jgi:hypothetical protein